ncbi:hypothetical protein THIOM_001802 [Candidatus Thiomargarita nelsonii]|uniref:Uncharacterized protein n=1 Tax=Candidatus Thiomargarita nelsonii TaxID=1003181 RepID=A0A176S3A5_9GAMM|nr:hypothetical protein THIOM_001802 [Candidatus Thiomargarita nelsonii]
MQGVPCTKGDGQECKAYLAREPPRFFSCKVRLALLMNVITHIAPLPKIEHRHFSSQPVSQFRVNASLSLPEMPHS